MLRNLSILALFAMAILPLVGCQQARSLQGTWTGTTPEGATVQLEFGPQSALSGHIEVKQMKVILGGTYSEEGDTPTMSPTVVDVELPATVPPQVREPMMKAMKEQAALSPSSKITWQTDDQITIDWAGQTITMNRT